VVGGTSGSGCLFGASWKSSADVVDQLVSDLTSGDGSRGIGIFDKLLVSSRTRLIGRGSGWRAEERKLRMSAASFGFLCSIFTALLGDFRTALVSSSRPNLRLVLWRGVKELLLTAS
jgi:hypothetical protein